MDFIEDIKHGAIFIYPTDTIYGIGCDATNSESVKRIRELKITAIPHHKGENWIGMFSTHLFHPSLISPIELNEKTLWALGEDNPSYKLVINKEMFDYKILSGFIQGWFNVFIQSRAPR